MMRIMFTAEEFSLDDMNDNKISEFLSYLDKFKTNTNSNETLEEEYLRRETDTFINNINNNEFTFKVALDNIVIVNIIDDESYTYDLDNYPDNDDERNFYLHLYIIQ